MNRLVPPILAGMGLGGGVRAVAPGRPGYERARHGAGHLDAFDWLPTPAMVLDEHQSIVTANRALCDLLGRDAAQLCGTDPLSFHFTEDRAHLLTRRDEWLRQPVGLTAAGLREGEERDGRLRRADGSTWHYRSQYREVRTDDGRVHTVVLMVGTELERVSQRLTEHRVRHLHGFFDSAPLPMIMRDQALRITAVNRAFCAKTGYAAHELVGHRDSLIDQDGDGRATPRLHAALLALAPGATDCRELAIHDRQGRVFQVEQRVSRIDGSDGRISYVTAWLEPAQTSRSDAAERESLERAVQQRDVLVREVHHRIKNNLQGVAGLLRQMAGRRPELADALDDIAGQVQAIAQVHGLHVRDDKVLLPAQMVEAVFASLARNFGVAIGFDSARAGEAAAPKAGTRWRIPEQEAVPVALVINELGTNAIKHRAPGGRVAVQLSVLQDGIMIDITNTGSLPADFDLKRLAHSVSGLALVKSMLPRRGAVLTIDERDGKVHACLQLRPPVLADVPALDGAALDGAAMASPAQAGGPADIPPGRGGRPT